MTRFVSLAVAAFCVLMSSQAVAEPVSVADRDGKAWVMLIEPLRVVEDTPEFSSDETLLAETSTSENVALETATETSDAGDAGVATDLAQPLVETAAAVTNVAPPAPASVAVDRPEVHGGFGMVIVPRGAASDDDLARRYKQIYNSIPFNRAEYVANPSYRHDATMELLTGNPRPAGGKTGQVTKTREYTPYKPYLRSKSDYYSFRGGSYWGGLRYRPFFLGY